MYAVSAELMNMRSHLWIPRETKSEELPRESVVQPNFVLNSSKT